MDSEVTPEQVPPCTLHVLGCSCSTLTAACVHLDARVQLGAGQHHYIGHIRRVLQDLHHQGEHEEFNKFL